MANQYRIGFLGLGNMGSAILNGILTQKIFSENEIAFYAPSKMTKEKYSSIGIHLATDEVSLCQDSEIIILAIKPQIYSQVFEKIKEISYQGKVIISLAPGKTIAYLESIFQGSDIIRAMPNTPAKIGKAMTSIAYHHEEGFIKVKEIFSSIGEYIVLKEEQIDKAIPLNGSLPAYLLEFAKDFIAMGEEIGLSNKEAKDLVLKSIIGSCLLALNSDEDMDCLINQVCSKGGSTIAGLDELRKNKLQETIEKCFRACVRRSKELANE